MSVQLPPASVSSPQVLASLSTALVLNIVIIFFVVDDGNKAQGYIYLTLALLLLLLLLSLSVLVCLVPIYCDSLMFHV